MTYEEAKDENRSQPRQAKREIAWVWVFPAATLALGTVTAGGGLYRNVYDNLHDLDLRCQSTSQAIELESFQRLSLADRLSYSERRIDELKATIKDLESEVRRHP